MSQAADLRGEGVIVAVRRIRGVRKEHLKLVQPGDAAGPNQVIPQQRPADKDATYVPHALSVPQFATLYAVLRRMISRLHEAIAAPSHAAVELDADLAGDAGAVPVADAQAYPLGLDELDTLARTRTGYAFADLTPELQDVVLDMVAAGDLTTGKLDLAVWLEEVRRHTRKPDAA